MDLIITVAIIIAAILFLVLFFTFVPLGLWISARASGVHIGIFQLVGMRIRKVVPSRIVSPLIKATKAGLTVSINKLEAHYLAGGNVDRVVNSLIAAQRATEAGVDMVIADGDKPALLYDIMEGKQVGTYFVGRSK